MTKSSDKGKSSNTDNGKSSDQSKTKSVEQNLMQQGVEKRKQATSEQSLMQQGVGERKSESKKAVGNTQTGLEAGDWSLPPNVKPSEIRIRERPDGKTSVVYGTERNEDGRITGDHGHTVLEKDGKPDYARTIGGTVKKDTGK